MNPPALVPQPRRSVRRRASIVGSLLALVVGGLGTSLPAAHADGTSSLPSCPFWSSVTPPQRGVTSWVPPLQTAKAVDFSARMAPPSVAGSLANGKVTFTLSRMPGAVAYRVWRNGQAVAWVSDWGQPTLTAVDAAPCQNANYSVVALSDQSGSDASMGRLAPYTLDASGSVVPWQALVGKTIPMLVTSYNDGGQTASGYNAQLGVCAVDPRVIPWGAYFTVPDYGTCYAGDIGLWIQNDTVDLWLPDAQANGWGVQSRTITFIADPFASR